MREQEAGAASVIQKSRLPLQSDFQPDETIPDDSENCP